VVKQISKVPSVACVVVLLTAVFERWPYGFYTVLRIVVCLSAAYLAFEAKKLRKPRWMWLMVGTALLFNPVAPVGLSRSDWQPLDLIAAVLFAVSVSAIRQKKQAV
jgi:hypothetical protein